MSLWFSSLGEEEEEEEEEEVTSENFRERLLDLLHLLLSPGEPSLTQFDLCLCATGCRVRSGSPYE